MPVRQSSNYSGKNRAIYMGFKDEIQRRRTFGIISHPDAGKTTLTEKLLLFGGAIHVAGAVSANKVQTECKQSALRSIL